MSENPADPAQRGCIRVGLAVGLGFILFSVLFFVFREPISSRVREGLFQHRWQTFRVGNLELQTPKPMVRPKNLKANVDYFIAQPESGAIQLGVGRYLTPADVPLERALQAFMKRAPNVQGEFFPSEYRRVEGREARYSTAPVRQGKFGGALEFLVIRDGNYDFHLILVRTEDPAAKRDAARILESVRFLEAASTK